MKKNLILLNVPLYIKSFDNYVYGMMIDRRCHEAQKEAQTILFAVPQMCTSLSIEL